MSRLPPAVLDGRLQIAPLNAPLRAPLSPVSVRDESDVGGGQLCVLVPTVAVHRLKADLKCDRTHSLLEQLRAVLMPEHGRTIHLDQVRALREQRTIRRRRGCTRGIGSDRAGMDVPNFGKRMSTNEADAHPCVAGWLIDSDNAMAWR